MTTAIIISVYKNTTDLAVVLKALEQQSVNDFTTIISEDGESDIMLDFLTNYKSSLTVKHLTQPDEGWRKNKALNNAIRNSTADYLIFIDGDCVPHPKFVEEHIAKANKEFILAGKRIKLGPKYSQLLREEVKEIDQFTSRIPKEFLKIKEDGAQFVEEGAYISSDSLFSFIPKLRSMKQLKGCNFSCYREALVKINGFDEDYIKPAIGEDIDLTWRFKGLGYQLFSMRNLAVQYHLHHRENWTDQSENEVIMKEKVANNQFVAINGLRND